VHRIGDEAQAGRCVEHSKRGASQGGRRPCGDCDGRAHIEGQQGIVGYPELEGFSEGPEIPRSRYSSRQQQVTL
jgi:hypothetical protein